MLDTKRSKMCFNNQECDVIRGDLPSYTKRSKLFLPLSHCGIVKELNVGSSLVAGLALIAVSLSGNVTITMCTLGFLSGVLLGESIVGMLEQK